ncbi:MAG TPA: hypothetical protein VLI40_02120 [Gemmatimonadaceae bacterium]|nr:hypothetical protein [Gemmatimonadaceae bacterium]
MTSRRAARAIVIASTIVATIVVGACATAHTSQFASAMSAHNWTDAATALAADTTLLHNESTLFDAAMLYSFPNRPTYNPARARELFERLLRDYPNTSRRQQAIDQLSLLYELQKTSNAAVAKQEGLRAQIAQLASDTLKLRRSIDSIAVRLQAEQDQSALLRKVATRLESDLQDRENQLNVLHDELNHLKAIDLRSTIRTPSGDTALKKPRKP